MAFDGSTLCGQALRIRRPKDYCNAPGHIPKVWNVHGVIGTQVEDGPYKIFMGGNLILALLSALKLMYQAFLLKFPKRNSKQL